MRFIELMPVGDMRELTWDHVVPSDEVLERIAALGALTDDDGTGARQRAGAVLPDCRARPAPSA